MSLSPWDLNAISFDFTLYRPRRASYVYATQLRQRSESYRSATKSDSTAASGGDFIENFVQQKRKDSYKIANEHYDLEEFSSVVSGPLTPVTPMTPMTPRGSSVKITVEDTSKGHNCIETTINGNDTPINTPTTKSEKVHDFEDDVVFAIKCHSGEPLHKEYWYKKNLIILSLSFILVFSAFRSIQNLQSSLNKESELGMIAMTCIYTSMFLTCLCAPVLIGKLTSKWTIVLGLLFYLFWTAANFYPHFYTLIPTSIGVGFGQSLAWGAQVSYMEKLASDAAIASKTLTQSGLYRYNGIFLACFQTSHIWGNLVSSILLSSELSNHTNWDKTRECGVFEVCGEIIVNANSSEYNQGDDSLAPRFMVKLMASFLVFVFIGFVFILFFLDKIGAKTDPEKPCLQMVWNNLQHLFGHKIYRLLIPLLVFNGFEQAFVYADYNRSYINCAIGPQWIGYNMITLGMSNCLFSFMVGISAKHLPREAIVGIGAILNLSLIVFLLVWIPDKNLKPVFFILSALWGLSDAIWQTQCNCLVNISCSDNHHVAFQNFRMLQGFGAALAFFLGAFLCVSVKLYIIITLLLISVLFYALAERQLRKHGL